MRHLLRHGFKSQLGSCMSHSPWLCPVVPRRNNSRFQETHEESHLLSRSQGCFSILGQYPRCVSWQMSCHRLKERPPALLVRGQVGWESLSWLKCVSQNCLCICNITLRPQGAGGTKEKVGSISGNQDDNRLRNSCNAPQNT